MADNTTHAYVSFICPACRQEIEAPQEMTGQTVECPSCGARLVVAPRADGGTDGADAPTAAQLEAMKSRTIRIELSDL